MNAAEVARLFYESFSNGKMAESLSTLVDTEAVLENPLPGPIPFGDRFEGREGFAAYLQAIPAAIDIEQFEVDDILSEGDRVVVLGRETSRVLSTDKRYTMSWVHVLRVHDGRIQHFREYNDTAAMLAAFS